MTNESSVSIDLVRILLKFLTKKNVNLDAFLKDIKLTECEGDLNNTEQRILIKKFKDIIWTAVKYYPHEDFGVQFGSEVIKSHFGGNGIFTMMLNSATLGIALNKLCAYHKVMSDAFTLELECINQQAVISWEVTYKQFNNVIVEDILLSTLIELLNYLSNNSIAITETKQCNQIQNNIEESNIRVPPPLKLNNIKSSILFDKKHLNLPILFADPYLSETLEQYTINKLKKFDRTNTITNLVIDIVQKELLSGEQITISKVAKELAFSTRTLQKKLKSEGTSFQKQRREVRMKCAENLLKNNHNSISEIALMLGFSEQSSFNHAFKRWGGTAPNKYRKLQLANAS